MRGPRHNRIETLRDLRGSGDHEPCRLPSRAVRPPDREAAPKHPEPYQDGETGGHMTANEEQLQAAMEELESLRIQEKRIQGGDALMQLQVNRVSQRGDIESLPEDQRMTLFNPDGILTDAEVMRRMDTYLTEHSKIAFDEGQQRRQVIGIGTDSDGNERMPRPGERVNPQGYIEMVDPRYADEVAQKLRDADEVDVKNSFQRTAAMNEAIMQLTERTQDPIGAYYVTFEQSRKLVEQYEAEKAAGWPHSRHDYIPMTAYMDKISPK